MSFGSMGSLTGRFSRAEISFATVSNGVQQTTVPVVMKVDPTTGKRRLIMSALRRLSDVVVRPRDLLRRAKSGH